MTTLYGIKNCDTVKKARRWLDRHHPHYHFHDFRVDGLDGESVAAWARKVGKDSLINKRSTTWKQLSAQERASFSAEDLSGEALNLILQAPTLLKRPILSDDDVLLVGFAEPQYQELFR